MRPFRPLAPLLVALALAVSLAVSLAGCAKGPDGGLVLGPPRYVTQESASMEPTIGAGQRVRTWPLPDHIERGGIDGRPIAEPYLAPGVSTGGVHELQLGQDQYYVLGDNRPDSADSRFKGPVTKAQLLAYAKG